MAAVTEKIASVGPRPSRVLLLALETAVVAGALATIPLTGLLEREVVPTWVQVADWIIWSVFLLEYLVMLRVNRSAWHYIKSNPINILVVALSFPHLPAILSLVRVVRLARFARFLRILRLAGTTVRAISALGVVLGRKGFVYVASLSLIIVLAGGSGLSLLEPQTVHGGFFDGVWWAIVTASTVGYGDIAPVTFGGRLIAVALMLTGVGLISTLAASITAHFVAHDESAELRELSERIARIETLLHQLAADRRG